jgi:hypothetical protein
MLKLDNRNGYKTPNAWFFMNPQDQTRNKANYHYSMLSGFYDNQELEDFSAALNSGNWNRELAIELLWEQTKENDQSGKGNSMYSHIHDLEMIFNPSFEMGDLEDDPDDLSVELFLEFKDLTEKITQATNN